MQGGNVIFQEAAILDAYIIQPEAIEDNRGFFARTFCCKEFEARGLRPILAQCSLSFNFLRGTLRGMHYQVAPHAEVRLVRCTRGAIYDVLVDLRRGSSTFGKWLAAELSDENRKAVYIPEGVAHGFQTLVDNTEVFYQMSEFYEPASARGVRWDDPAFAIHWPLPPSRISSRDANFPCVSLDSI
jgi:dTDP-4-dehydrorhamnose 3,5-epimerase